MLSRILYLKKNNKLNDNEMFYNCYIYIYDL